jgi:hypothetical protein
MKRHIALAVASIAVAAGLPLAYAQDMAVTAGNKAKVILDNDKVRVLNWRFHRAAAPACTRTATTSSIG